MASRSSMLIIKLWPLGHQPHPIPSRLVAAVFHLQSHRVHIHRQLWDSEASVFANWPRWSSAPTRASVPVRHWVSLYCCCLSVPLLCLSVPLLHTSPFALHVWSANFKKCKCHGATPLWQSLKNSVVGLLPTQKARVDCLVWPAYLVPISGPGAFTCCLLGSLYNSFRTWVCWFLIAAVTDYHKISGLKQ